MILPFSVEMNWTFGLNMEKIRSQLPAIFWTGLCLYFGGYHFIYFCASLQILGDLV